MPAVCAHLYKISQNLIWCPEGSLDNCHLFVRELEHFFLPKRRVTKQEKIVFVKSDWKLNELGKKDIH